MEDRPKCSECNERDVFAKGLCSGCYGKQWRAKQKGETVAPRQLTDGSAAPLATVQSEHLVATDPAGMQAAQGDLKLWLEQRLAIIERDILATNAALTEAKRNGWATAALTRARNRAVDDETFYNKILTAVEAGYTIIPDFPISVFAVRRGEPVERQSLTYNGYIQGRNTGLGRPVPTDSAPVGVGEYENPRPETVDTVRENKTPNAQASGQPRYFTSVRRTGRPAGPIEFPTTSAREPLMNATAKAMELKAFDQFGMCFPVVAATATSRQVQTQSARAGDPMVIGQVVRKKVGSQQRVISFIIGWYLDLKTL